MKNVLIAIAVLAAIGPQLPAMSISGRIVSAATGKPVPGATATANCEGCDFVVSGKTDADGWYQITVGSAARYRVSAAAPGYVTLAYGAEPEIGHTPVAVGQGAAVGDIDIRLHRGSTIAGVVTDAFKDPVVGATVRALARGYAGGEFRLIARASTQTDDRGTYRLIGLEAGEYVIGASDGLSLTLAASTSASAVTSARRVTVGEDAEVEGVNIRTTASARGAVEGVVAGPGAGSAGLAMGLLPDPNPTSLPALAIRAQGGRFQVADVPAGRYVLIVRPVSTGTRAATSFQTSSPSWAREPVAVSADATTHVAITLRAGARISGRVESLEPLRGARISIAPIDTDHPEASTAQAALDPAGSFVMMNVAPGRYRWMPNQQLSRSGERLMSVLIKDEDVTDAPLDIAPDSVIENVRITLTEPARLAGTVADSRGGPTTAGAVVVAASDSRYWTPVSRRLLVVRPDTAGRFEVRLPAGRYRVAPIASLATGQLWDPAFLKTLGKSQTVTLTAGQTTKVQLQGK